MDLRLLAPALALLLGPDRISALPRSGDGTRRRRRWLPVESSYRQKLDSYQDLQYYSTISVGGQALKALIDTTTVELVVLGSKCKYWCGLGKNFYHGRGRHYRKGNLGVVLTYSDGDLRGNEAYDKMYVGPFVAPTQPLWEITDANMKDLYDTSFEAIFGLGPVSRGMRTLSPKDPLNPLAYALSLDASEIFRYSLCLDWRPGFPGFITWNDEILSVKADKFSSIALIPSSYWLTSITDIRLGDKLIGCSRGCGAILDSGTPLISAPPNPYELLIKSIMDLAPNCQNLKNLPELTFNLGGVPHKLPPAAYLSEFFGDVPESMNPYFDVKSFESANKTESSCQPSVLRVEVSSDEGAIWVLGVPFFRSYYTHFVQGRVELYTAESPNDCDMEGDDDDDEPMASARMPDSARFMARMIDVSKLSLPMWLRRGAYEKFLPSGPMDRTISELPMPKKRGIHWIDNGTDTGW